MTLDNNLKLAENAVLSIEESLSKVFQERSNPVSYTHLTLPTTPYV